REITSALLRDLGYEVIEAGSGGAALDMLDRERGVYRMLIDFAMPGMNGAEVARHVTSKRPGLPVLFVTGFADRGALEGVSEAYIVGKLFIDEQPAPQVTNALPQR